MIQTAQATFQIQCLEMNPFGESRGGPELTRSSYRLTYDGDLKGEGILEELKVRFSEKRAATTGLMKFTGRVGDFHGSFVLSHTGKFVNGRMTSTQTVVPGSATEGLKGLRGAMRHDSGSTGRAFAEFRYRFA